MNDKKYFITLVTFFYLVSIGVFFISGYIFSLNLSFSEDDELLKYQAEKIKKEDYSIIVVGDSSAGNAIDAYSFSELSGQKTINLALNGGFGLAGTFNMIAAAYEKNENLKNVVIIQTLDIWKRPFSESGYIKTQKILKEIKLSNYYSNLDKSILYRYKYDPKNIKKYLDYKKNVGKREFQEYIYKDYVVQADSKFSNDGRKLLGDETLSSYISEDNIETLKAIGLLCHDLGLSCVFVSGPIHEEVFARSYGFKEKLFPRLHDIPGLHFVDEVVLYPNNLMGDSIDHVDYQIKELNTKKYFDLVFQFLTR